MVVELTLLQADTGHVSDASSHSEIDYTWLKCNSKLISFKLNVY